LENKTISWELLPASEVFKRYLKGDAQLSNFFESDPFLVQPIQHPHTVSIIDSKKRAELLRDYNRDFDLHEEQKRNIERLSSPESLCVVTGQQLTIFGGPLYTFFKIITTIIHARKLSVAYGRPVIPVFWMADEDHDFQEIATIYYPKSSGLEQCSIKDEDQYAAPVAERLITDDVIEAIEHLFNDLGQTEFSSSVQDLLSESYKKGDTHRKAFGTLITKIFGKYGLVLAGSNHPSIKKAFISQFIRSIDNPSEIESALHQQSELLRVISKPQAQVSDSLLFYIDPKNNHQRIRIRRDGTGWYCGSLISWSDQEIRSEIENHPERFSPNVFLRPILQDTLLPNLAYVAGPGEIGYYAQMRTFYKIFGQQMPCIYPRHSATLVEPGIARLMTELPFDFEEYLQRSEVLEKLFLSNEKAVHPEVLSQKWTQIVRDGSKPFILEISKFDASLEASAQKVMAEFEESVERLMQKLVRSIKQKEQTSLNRITRVKNALFPNEGLQERSVCGIYFMNKYGLDIWDRLINQFEMIEPNTHHLIKF